jgi:hypothetical protein
MELFNTVTKFALIALITVFNYGCSKDDTTAPIITLSGDNPYEKTIDPDYTEPGYTAEDDEDGDITNQVIVSNGVLDAIGTYAVEYSVTDAAGNEGSATRTVIVKNAADALKGTYAVVITCPPPLAPYNYTESINMFTTLDNRILFGKFGDYDNSENKVYGNVTQISGTFTSINIPQQTINNIGNPAANRTFSGSGTISVSGGVTTISINVDETISGQGTVSCTYTYTK